MLSSRWSYYLSSLPTLAFGVKSWWTMAAAFLGLPIKTPFVVTLRNGLQFEARTGLDVWVIKESCLDRDYEQHSVAIQDGWTVLDIGAALGDFAIHAAQHTPNGWVYAYEPAPDSFRLLQRNSIRNQVRNITALPYAVNGDGSSMIMDTTAGEPVLYQSAATNAVHQQHIVVKGVTLDQVFRDNRITRCDFLKIDCEGAEYDLLLHASDATLGMIRHICLEYHDSAPPATHPTLVRFFEQKGFAVRRVPNPVHQETGFLYAYRTGDSD